MTFLVPISTHSCAQNDPQDSEGSFTTVVWFIWSGQRKEIVAF